MRIEELASAMPRRVRRAGLREEVYETLLEMLVENRIDEGAPLRVEALARLLDVSPTPVREALVQLESTGLVVYAPNRGYTVAPLPSAADIREIMDARSILEIAAARRAAQAASAAENDALAAVLARQEQAATAVAAASDSERVDVVRAYLRTDHAFHDAVFTASGNSHLHALASRIDAQSQRARQSFRNGVSDASEAIAEHRAIADAIARGDADAAEAAMSTHLEHVLERSLDEAG